MAELEQAAHPGEASGDTIAQRDRQDEEQGEVPNWLRPFDPSEQWDDEELAPEGWSGLAEHYDNGKDDLEFSAEESKWSLLSHRKNSTEVNLKNLTDEQRQQFMESDLTEWEAILKSGAVRVVAATEAKAVQRRHPDRGRAGWFDD